MQEKKRIKEFRVNGSMKCRNFGDSGHGLCSRGTQSSHLFSFFLNCCPLALIVPCFNICAYFWAEFPLSYDFSGSSLGHKYVLRLAVLYVPGLDPE